MVMSKRSSEAFGLAADSNTTCVGTDEETFQNCGISLHGNKTYWDSVRANGIKFVEATHDREIVKNTWQNVVELARKKFQELKNDE